MPLSLDQGQAVIAALRSDTAAALARAQQVKSDAESGIIHGVMSTFGLTADALVDRAAQALQDQLGTIDGMERALPAAVADPARGDSWTALARNLQANLATWPQYQESATVDAILSSAVAKTAQQFKDGANAVAGFALSAIPWWVFLAGAAVLAVAVLALRAQARAVVA